MASPTRTEGAGTINGLQEGDAAYLEEVFVSFHDLGQGLYAAEGDQVSVSVDET